MIKIFRSLCLVLVALICLSLVSIVKADYTGAQYYTPITISNSGSSTYSNIRIPMAISSSSLISLGAMQSDADDSYLMNSSTPVSFTPSVVSPASWYGLASLSSYGSSFYRLYTGNPTEGPQNRYWIVQKEDLSSVADSASLDITDHLTLSINAAVFTPPTIIPLPLIHRGYSYFLDIGKFEEPSTLEAVATTLEVGLPYQQQSFYANGRYWAFYTDGTNMNCTTSTDGTTWAAHTDIRASVDGNMFSVWFDGTHFSYVYKTSAAVATYYRKGTPNADGSITWLQVEQTFNWPVAASLYPVICVDGSGNTWIACGTGAGSFTPRIVMSSATDGTWSTAAGFPVALDATAAVGWVVQILPLVSGSNTVVVIGQQGTTSVQADRVTPAGVVTSIGHFGTAPSVGSSISCTSTATEVYITYMTGATDIRYYTLTGFAGAGTVIVTGCAATSFPFLSYSSSLNILACNIYAYPNTDKIGAIRYDLSTSTWGSYVVLYNDGSEATLAVTGLNGSHYSYGGKTSLLWGTTAGNDAIRHIPMELVYPNYIVFGIIKTNIQTTVKTSDISFGSTPQVYKGTYHVADNALKVYVDGTEKASVAHNTGIDAGSSGLFSMWFNGTADDFKIGSVDIAAPTYVCSLTMESSTISSTTITDQTGTGNNLTLSLITYPSISATIGGLTSVSNFGGTIGAVTNVAAVYRNPNMPLFENTSLTGSNLPVYALFVNGSASLGWTTTTLYGIMMVMVSFVMGFGGLIATHSVLAGIIIGGATMTLAAATEVFPWWAPIVTGILTLIAAYVARSY